MQSLLNLVIDVGNTRIKAAAFSGKELVEKHLFDSSDQVHDFLKGSTYNNVIVSSVRNAPEELLGLVNAQNKKLIVSRQLHLPVIILYTTPDTLGIDRLAAACGAVDMFPNRDCLVIDAGTCINYEFVDKVGNYYGGAISPGIQMRFKAMYTFTERLPLVDAVNEPDLTGGNTIACMQSGVINGVVAEADGIISQYKEKYPNIAVVLCGGDGIFFENKLKHSIFATPDLVLRGLNLILLHNV